MSNNFSEILLSLNENLYFSKYSKNVAENIYENFKIKYDEKKYPFRVLNIVINKSKYKCFNGILVERFNSLIPIIICKLGYINIFSDIPFFYLLDMDKNSISPSYASSYFFNVSINNKEISDNKGFIGINNFLNNIETDNIIEMIEYFKGIKVSKEDLMLENLIKSAKEIKLSEYPKKYYDLLYPIVLKNIDKYYLVGYNKKTPYDFEIYYINNEENIIDMKYINYFIEKGINTSLIELFINYKIHEFKKEKIYNIFKIPKKDGGMRIISEPVEDIKKNCKELLYILNKSFNKRISKKESYQFAYINKRSILQNANIHKNNKYVIKFDIRKFFDNCRFNMFKKYIEYFYKNLKAYYYDEIENLLKNVLIDPNTGGLYMGNPLSGVLSNMIINPSAVYIKNICNKYNISFSIYADDITFSCDDISNEYFNKNFLKKIILEAFKYYDLDFVLNEDKTRKLKNNGRRITGVRINHRNETTPDRYHYNLLKSVLEHLEHNKKITMTKNELQGRISYYLYIDSSGKFRKLINKYYYILKDYGINISDQYIDEHPGIVTLF